MLDDYAALVREMTDDALVDSLDWYAREDGYGQGHDPEDRRRADVCKAELKRRLAAKKEGKA